MNHGDRISTVSALRALPDGTHVRDKSGTFLTVQSNGLCSCSFAQRQGWCGEPTRWPNVGHYFQPPYYLEELADVPLETAPEAESQTLVDGHRVVIPALAGTCPACNVRLTANLTVEFMAVDDPDQENQRLEARVAGCTMSHTCEIPRLRD